MARTRGLPIEGGGDISGVAPYVRPDPGSQYVTGDTSGNKFLPGGDYGPESVMDLLKEILEARQRASDPGIGAMSRYGRAAQDMAARGNALSSGQAYRQLEGLNPAARSSAMGSIAQRGGASVGSIGAQGMMQGGNLINQVGLGNLAANTQNRGMQSSFFGGALDRSLGAQQFDDQMAMQKQQFEWMRRMQKRQSDQALWSSLLGGVGNIIPFL